MKIRIDRIFLVIGTAVFLTLVTIVLYNFVNDSRLIAGKTTEQIGNQEEVVLPTNISEDTDSEDDYKTLRYQRKADPTPTKAPSPKPSSSPSKDKDAISVELINYTGINKVGDEVKKMLEDNGYIVSAGSASSISFVSTKIVEKSDKRAGNAIRNLLKAGKVTESLGTESRFDVTIVLGDDYIMP